MLHRKPYIKNHLRNAEKHMTARLEWLSTSGLPAERIGKDNQIKHFKAQMRKAKFELAAIASMESLMAEKAQSRIRKEAAAVSEASLAQPKKRDRNMPPAKKRKKVRVESDEEE